MLHPVLYLIRNTVIINVTDNVRSDFYAPIFHTYFIFINNVIDFWQVPRKIKLQYTRLSE